MIRKIHVGNAVKQQSFYQMKIGKEMSCSLAPMLLVLVVHLLAGALNVVPVVAPEVVDSKAIDEAAVEAARRAAAHPGEEDGCVTEDMFVKVEVPTNHPKGIATKTLFLVNDVTVQIPKWCIDMRVQDDAVGDGGAAAIAEALEENKVVKKLSLESNNIGPNGATALAAAISVNTALDLLDLTFNPIGYGGAAALGAMLKVNTVLQELYLADCHFRGFNRDGAVVEIANALKVNTKLDTLDLENNTIGDAGAIAIAGVLKVNTSVLSFLILSENFIEINGARAIAEALKVNTVLDTLDLQNNDFGDEGAIMIAEALKVNTAIEWLGLYGNGIGDAGAAAIAEALKVNTVITTLKLHDTDSVTDNRIKDKTILLSIEKSVARNKRIYKAAELEKKQSCDSEDGDGGQDSCSSGLRYHPSCDDDDEE